MAKPLNPYQGPAPAAMGMMGQGILEAGANIGRTLQGGYESMGKSIAGGINTAVGEYAKYKDTQSQVKAAEKSYNTIKDYLDPELRKGFDSQIEALNQDTGVSLRDKAAFWDQSNKTLGSFVSQGFQMEKQKKELEAAAARQASQIAANQMQPYYDRSASLLMSPTGSPIKGAGYGGGRSPGSGVSLQDEEPFQFNKVHR